MTTAKELIFEEQAREKLSEGLKQLAAVVSVTLGPKGLSVGLQPSFGTPTITNDGNTIVKDIEFKDQYLNMGASMAKEAAAKMKEKCGDGTTTTILLLHALVQNGLKNISSGASPISLKRGMDKALETIVRELTTLSIPVKSDKETKNIATISASGNEEVGTVISNAIKKAGKSGVITIEEGKTTETVIEIVEGMQFDRGYSSSYFCTNAENLTVEMHDAKILITDKKISSVQEILPLLQSVASTSQELLIIAEDIEGDALSTLVINKLRGTLKICAVKAPGFGDRRKAMLEDIAVLTGATVVSEETGMVLKEVSVEVLGEAEKIVITKEKTTLISGKGDPEKIKARVKQLASESKAAESSYDKEKIEERKAKLAGGVAVIYVGAPTEPEMRQKKQAFEDSLNSTKAALEEGIVPGGGIALLRASKTAKLKLHGDELTGAQILLKACEAPLRQIVANSGLDGSVLLEQILSSETSMGFNAQTEKVEDLLASGVVDPLKVVKHGLQFAVSSAGMILLSEVLIGNAPDDNNNSIS
ncbi:MAG TPA: chaperonin GroEL [Rhabdochlamydiaceae bacterium]|jgi:chaperonin GroEL|nr:chaperonin GroEL [Rhabdochlamydiaceae bacterium]